MSGTIAVMPQCSGLQMKRLVAEVPVRITPDKSASAKFPSTGLCKHDFPERRFRANSRIDFNYHPI